MANFLTIGPDKLKTLLSQCAAFQSVTGAANATDALASIAKHYLQPSLALPRALVGWDDGLSLRKGSSSHFQMDGELALMFEFAMPAAQQGDLEAGDDWFLAQTGEILKELGTLILAGGTLNVVEFVADPAIALFDQDLTTIGDDDMVDITKASDARWSKWTLELGGPAFGA